MWRSGRDALLPPPPAARMWWWWWRPLAALLALLPVTLRSQESCPTSNHTVCRCEYGDLVCPTVTAVPRFNDNGFLYRSVDFSDQAIEQVPEASFFQLKVKKIWLESNPIGPRLHVNSFAGKPEGVLEELSVSNCMLPNLRQVWFGGFIHVFPYVLFFSLCSIRIGCDVHGGWDLFIIIVHNCP